MVTGAVHASFRARFSKPTLYLHQQVKQAVLGCVEERVAKALSALDALEVVGVSSDLVLLDMRVTLIKELLLLGPTTYAAIEEKIGRPLTYFESYELEQLFLEMQEELQMHQKRLAPFALHLHDRQEELKNQRRWLKLELPEALLITHADCVEFMMKSGFGFSLKMFRHAIEIQDGEPYFLYEGTLKPWSEIKGKLQYDQKLERVVSATDSKKEFNYISPSGFVQKSPTPLELYAIAELSQWDLARLLSHAEKVWKTHPEVDPGSEKRCVLQLVTSSEECLPSSCFTDPINSIWPEHATLRLIDPQGKVYSFGIQVEKQFEKFIKSHPFQFLATGCARVETPDYKETRRFHQRRITSIPITEKRLQTILELVKETNGEGGFRFCLTKQNCNKFALMVLSLAGISLDTQMSIPELFCQMVPHPLSSLKSRIQMIVEPFFRLVSSYTPAPIKRAFTFASNALLFVRRKLVTVLFTASMYFLFGARAVAQAPDPAYEKEEPMDQRRKIHFTRLMNSWLDIFDDEKLLLNHSLKMIQWQLKQASTTVTSYNERPTLHILPEV